MSSTEELIAHLTRNAKPVYVKPGNVLLIGNVGRIDADPDDFGEVLEQIKAGCGAKEVYLFEADIDVRMITDETATLAAELGIEPVEVPKC